MEELKGFPKYQWSIFPDGNKGEQYVVRADSWEEFQVGILKIKDKLMDANGPLQEELPKTIQNEDGSSESPKECLIHEESMFKAVSKKTNRPYWFHKNASGKMCFGTGYKD